MSRFHYLCQISPSSPMKTSPMTTFFLFLWLRRHARTSTAVSARTALPCFSSCPFSSQRPLGSPILLLRTLSFATSLASISAGRGFTCLRRPFCVHLSRASSNRATPVWLNGQYSDPPPYEISLCDPTFQPLQLPACSALEKQVMSRELGAEGWVYHIDPPNSLH